MKLLIMNELLEIGKILLIITDATIVRSNSRQTRKSKKRELGTYSNEAIHELNIPKRLFTLLPYFVREKVIDNARKTHDPNSYLLKKNRRNCLNSGDYYF